MEYSIDELLYAVVEPKFVPILALMCLMKKEKAIIILAADDFSFSNTSWYMRLDLGLKHENMG